MALSQLQCLDHNNVNWRSSEAKPEFFYSEEQRLALEALVSSGQDAFQEVVKRENIRNFLSEPELAKIVGRVEAFDPDYCPPRVTGDKPEKEGEEEGDPQEDVQQSLEYWPDRSDCSIPDLDLGWPDTVAYRGVTRATVYMQPPIDGQPHIKEVVRKMVTQAQKVIAVVMDLFTDVDIFKDMLEAGFKRKVGVYIILNESDVKYFLQMCEKAQMHKGHLKNLRIRSVEGVEFYTRFSTKFKGSLGQKFMFVDGDKAMCGSYSFTWSAARIDRNLITVLSGQVVESFDRQFQELYLLSKGVGLKNIPMDNEPIPEPVALPVSLPAGPTEAIARKLINPKYALVNVKSASDSGKDPKQEISAVKKITTKGRVSTFQQQVDEPQIHPALQDMERANMFDYLPTWTEPDPEPGSDILGYINIIDPSIKNAQLSQMNRIKICDTSQATAQFMQQSRENELKQNQNSPASSHNSNPSRQASQDEVPGPSNSKGIPSLQASQDEMPGPSSSKGSSSRQASQDEVPGPSSSKGSSSRQASQDEMPGPSNSKGIPSLQASQDEVPGPSSSKGSSSRQASQDEVPGPSSSKGSSSRQANHDEMPGPSSSKDSSSRQASQSGSVPSRDTMSTETSNLINDLGNQHRSQDSAAPDEQESTSLQKPIEGFAELAESHHLVSTTKGQGPAGGRPPPVPKPRTVPVTDFITMKNTLNAKSGRTISSTEENLVPSVNGVDAEGRETEDIDILIENDQDEDNRNIYQLCTGEYSSSGSGSQPPSNASSLSEEYYPSTPLQRRSSERISNGERPPLHRKLSDGHISRGSFLSPNNISQPYMDMRSVDNERRRSTLEEELKRVLSSSHPVQGTDRNYGSEPPQGKAIFQYSPNGTAGGYDRYHSNPATRSAGRGRGKKESMEGPGAYRQLHRKSEAPGARPGFWSSKDYGNSYTSPVSQSPVLPDNSPTPFGIPYSKLSQAKHLKSKIGAAGLDSRRKGHVPPGHKDL
ncbi:protein FAM83G [Mixophyes fleayi]|uniref:protein FAM83G n=1 Tax=Mixophyes fleayi TaxID=3061075 RepID=UPI003F4D9341